jgi:DNA-binding IclR family transcriptional regulator
MVTPGRQKPPTTIQSLQRGLAILELVSREGAGMTMMAVSRQMGLHPSTTFHLLRTLTGLGYLVHDEATKEYRLGSKIFHLAASSQTEMRLLRVSSPCLVDLAKQTGETAHFAVFERGEVIVINKVDGTSGIHVSERVGYPRPAHSTAIGKVLLAHLPAAGLRAYLDRHELAALTPKTIVAAPALEAELATVREQGFAFDDEEFAEGIRCLAAPVRSFTGHVVAAVGISGPVWRVSPDRVVPLADLVKAAARRLSQELGSPADGDPSVKR